MKCSGEMLGSWSAFKEAIMRRFERKVLFHVVIQKVEVRRWKVSGGESFLEYASEKLALMHGLNLPPREMIHLIISDISSWSLRETAAALNKENLDRFLQRMQSIVSASGEVDKKQFNCGKSIKKDECRGCAKKEHVVRKLSEAEKEKSWTTEIRRVRIVVSLGVSGSGGCSARDVNASSTVALTSDTDPVGK